MKRGESIETVYLAHRSSLIDYATPIVGRTRAEDIVQDAFIQFSKAHKSADKTGSEIKQPVGYLYRIVRNLCIDWKRHIKVAGNPPDFETALEQQHVDFLSPERTALYRDELRLMQEALGELPERTRTVFERHRVGGQTLQKIADDLGISVGLTHQLVREAMTHCASKLGPLEDE